MVGLGTLVPKVSGIGIVYENNAVLCMCRLLWISVTPWTCLTLASSFPMLRAELPVGLQASQNVPILSSLKQPLGRGPGTSLLGLVS